MQMTPRHICRILVLAIGLAGMWSSPAEAQWGTPSRAFHKDTTFPLDGKHLTVACTSCHANQVTKGTPTACADCHWVRRQDDPYRTRLGGACEQCHRTSSWNAVRWDHAAATGTILNAAHRTVDCQSCHRDRRFGTGSGTCMACHRADYEQTQSPPHAAAGFSTQCADCHRLSDVSFNQARFDHNATFPLVGTHGLQSCQSCHAGGRYRGTPRDCVGCHQDDYNRTATPNHAAAGFSTTCDSCHRPTDPDWSGATLNHNQFFLLEGRHATTACSSCHGAGIFRGTPRDCVACHRQQYDATTSPRHVSAGFPTTCDVCHRAADASWNQGRFSHVWFPITSGRHSGHPCSACHQNPNDYRQFTCLTCHGRTETDNEHRERPGYRYESAACYSCHPDGRS
jgi:hypothetical protein